MDIEESCLQLDIGNIGGEGRRDDDMDWIIKWIKKRKRRKKIKSLVQNSVLIGDFTGTSGAKLNHYIDCRPLIANSSTRIMLVKSLYDLINIKTYNNIIFAGPQTSGAILASEMALFKNTNSIILNLNKNEVIYPFGINLSDKKIILIDDVITTGYTIEKCIDLIKYPILQIVCIFNRSNLEEIREIGINSILNYRDIKIG